MRPALVSSFFVVVIGSTIACSAPPPRRVFTDDSPPGHESRPTDPAPPDHASLPTDPPMATTPRPTTRPPPTPPPPPPVATTCTPPKPTPDAVCVRDCGGPVVRDGDPPPGFSWLSPEHAARRAQFGCPICMPAGTLISTPTGEVRIERLAAGMFVTSFDELGKPFTAELIHVGSTPARDHTLVRVMLADGRVALGSAGHPLVDGRTFGTLRPGDRVDGSTVKGTSTEPYANGSTWDLLPEGPTGAYRADGVIVGSTLRARH